MGTFLLIPASAGGLNSVATFGDLPATANLGDAYLVRDTGVIYFWDSSDSWEATDAQLASSSASDTNSVDLTVTSGVLTADVKLSANAATSGYLKATTTIKTTGSTGLHVELPEASAGQTGVLKSTDFSTFAGKQAGDADLTAIAALAGPGFAVKTTTDPTAPAWANRTITGTSNRLSVTNGDGVSANPILNVDATQFPSSVLADSGKALVSGGANTASWGIPQFSIDSELTGRISWGGSGNYYSASGATFSILRSGVGRISSSKITWAGGESVVLTAGKGYYIGYSATNTIVAIDSSTIYSATRQTYYENVSALMKNNVILFEVWYDGIEMLVVKEDHEYAYPAEVSVHQHFSLGHVYTGTGGLISLLSSANRTIQTAGDDMLDDHGLTTRIYDSGGAALTTDCIYQNAGGTTSRLNRTAFTTAGFSVTPTPGAVYRDAGSTFTVTVLFVAANVMHCYRSSGVGAIASSGTLTKVSGTGDASVTYSSTANVRVIPSIYLAAGVPTPLATASNTNRWGIFAIYALKDDKQTPSTASPTPKYICVPSNTAYSGANANNAIASLGTNSAPDLTQFVIPSDFNELEPVLTGFVLIDGNTRIIPIVTSSGFVNGVRSYRATAGSSGFAGAASVTNAINVSTDTTSFAGWLSSADVNVQLALNSIAAKSSAIRTVTTDPTISTTDRTILCDCTSAQITVNLPAAASNLGRMMWIKKIDSSANKVVIEGNASETIDGALNQELISQFKSVQIQCDGSNWYILSSVWG